jgi:hypothetical protein
VKFKWRSLYTGGESGEPYFSIRIGYSFKIEPMHSSKTIPDMNPDGGSINGLAVYAQNGKVEGTAPHTALYGRNLFVFPDFPDRTLGFFPGLMNRIAVQSPRFVNDAAYAVNPVAATAVQIFMVAAIRQNLVRGHATDKRPQFRSIQESADRRKVCS